MLCWLSDMLSRTSWGPSLAETLLVSENLIDAPGGRRILQAAMGRPRLAIDSIGVILSRARVERFDVHPASTRTLYVGKACSDLVQKVGEEQEHNIRPLRGEFRWIYNGDVCPGHSEPVFGW